MPIVSGNTSSNCDNDNTIMPSSLEGHNNDCKRLVRYKECLKNHAAALGGNATDGCGEFMPSGGDGTPEGLKCSACNCHRNFHRKEVECNCSCDKRLTLGSCHNYIIAPSKDELPQNLVVGQYKNESNPSESDEKTDEQAIGGPSCDQGKKRFRTKFTQEQKEKLISFAEKAGWKIQKLDETVIQQFCQEIGIKRRVLKVWMHNNKHHYAKSKSNS